MVWEREMRGNELNSIETMERSKGMPLARSRQRADIFNGGESEFVAMQQKG